MDHNPPVLILIDVQKGFFSPYWGSRNNPDAEKTIASLLKNWRAREWPIIHVQHCSTEKDSPLRPTEPGVAFMDEAMPLHGERIIQKNVNSAFIGTNLHELLQSIGATQLFFCGFTTDHCVSTSVRMAKNFGYIPTIIADATVAFDRFDHLGNHYKADVVHAVSLASLNGEFAQVIESDTLLNSSLNIENLIKGK